ncbi:MAG: hypothetical protein A2X11_15525 [Bacteroidetes bacterium GWE2_42_24]|nr:MAG: hypothetical protein A2X11_15525 [Bacteroidetes bacterium GWE2_42_24]OFY29336.1 MAG: hypothetical protein A2X09_06315 [Bacteroidetes bacterium GWF2_43_11]
METKGIYIYGIIPNLYNEEMYRSLANAGIYTIAYQNISAIVSEREEVYFDFTDREELGQLLVEHQETIEDLTEKGFNMLIPMRLGTIAGTKEEVIKILANGHALIVDTLKKIENLTEIDLAVTWADFPATIQEIAGHPDIVTMKADILKNGDTISQIDQIKIGMLLEEKIKEKNKTIELDILNALSGFCTDIKTHEVMNDQMIANSAYLLNRNRKEKFEQVLDRLDEEYKGMLNFKMVGPLPCYSFYTIEVKELNPEHISEAKKDLGISETTSEAEIKRAYQEKVKEFHPDINQDNDTLNHFNRIKKAYQTLLDYLEATNITSKENTISETNERTIENLILVRIKE